MICYISNYKLKIYFEIFVEVDAASRKDTKQSKSFFFFFFDNPKSFDHAIYEDSLTTSSGTIMEGSSVEEFLEEVRQRLKCELQGKSSQEKFIS